MQGIEYTWDERKRESNLAKHKIDFADMHSFNWVLATIVPDENYEERLILQPHIDKIVFLRR